MFLSRPEADETNLATCSSISVSISCMGLGLVSAWGAGAAGVADCWAFLAMPGSSGALDEEGRWVAPASATVFLD